MSEAEVLFSADLEPIEWGQRDGYARRFGAKAAGLLCIPRAWTLPFALLTAEQAERICGLTEDRFPEVVGLENIRRLGELATVTKSLYVRSSVVGETIWDRGEYTSQTIAFNEGSFVSDLLGAIDVVRRSADGKPCGIVVQAAELSPTALGEFGNLIRVTKTRDQWELSYRHPAPKVLRYNSQRDVAASPSNSLTLVSNAQTARFFGKISAWINNELVRGFGSRVNCEWVIVDRNLFLVQIDEETEDPFGINPYQQRIRPIKDSGACGGELVRMPDQVDYAAWDKLKVISELWAPDEDDRPTLFFVPLEAYDRLSDEEACLRMSDELKQFVGLDDIVVRTSVRSDREKVLNLPRTEGVTAVDAANWCLAKKNEFLERGISLSDRAFIIHRFLDARSSAWVKAEPDSSYVVVHGLWGLPDALQFCPYDKWDVHVQSKAITEYAEYKSHMLVPKESGEWKLDRIQNDLGRSLSLSRSQVLEVSERTVQIAKRIGRAVHVMWFVGCDHPVRGSICIPWYWVDAPTHSVNPDRNRYREITIKNFNDVDRIVEGQLNLANAALKLLPETQSLMRNKKLISKVANFSIDNSVPVLLEGSTLAHAYYELQRAGCVVVATGEKDHERIRRPQLFGKLVRDKIPQKILNNDESESTFMVPQNLKERFLVGKLLEEAIEVREAGDQEDRLSELADLYEVFKALSEVAGLSIDDIVLAAESKKEKAGGFDQGLVLMQTGLLGAKRAGVTGLEKMTPSVMFNKIADELYEIPFSFFGFAGLGEPWTLTFPDNGVQVVVHLLPDRISIKIERLAEQLGFEF